jgi:N-acetylmuramoyl-L-alanine amidase
MIAAACGSSPATRAPAFRPILPPPDLPAIPPVDGSLRITVTYPLPDALLPAVDSNFIFGATGSGRATLSINGAGIEVSPNGAFLAFLPVPEDGVYRIVASVGSDTVSREYRVRITPAPAVSASGATILTETVQPAGAFALRYGETIEISFLGTRGGQATLRLPEGERVPLVEQPLGSGASADIANFSAALRASGHVNGVSRYVGSAPADDWVAADSTVPRPAVGRNGYPSSLLGIVVGFAQSDTLSERLAREAGLPVPNAAERDSIAGLARRFGSVADSLLGFAARFPYLNLRTPIIELVIGTDTARVPLRVNLRGLLPHEPISGLAQPPAGAAHDWTARGRPGLNGPFHWFFPPGTRFAIDGERNGVYRVRLSPDVSTWVSGSEIRLLAAGTPEPDALVTGVRFLPDSGHVDVRIMMPMMLPFRVDADASALDITVYSATSAVNFFQYGALDPLIERAAWSQPADGQFRVHIESTEPVWGWLPFFDEAGALVVRIRRPPQIDPERPLNGLRIAVDAGHPPAGGTGPTGLTEAEANLGVALKLRPMLERAGATVLMTRTEPGPVDLAARPRMATEWNAHVLLSLHNNAFPDGVNPFVNHGTSVYYFQPHSVDLAKLTLRELLDELGMRDIGIGRADLALVRPSWMPSILSETLFMMVPQQEAALRDALVQERIARAHLRALEAFLRERASRAARR